jgi:hypothetical protein
LSDHRRCKRYRTRDCETLWEADGRVVIGDLDPTKAAQAASELGDKKTAIGIARAARD